MWKSLDSGGNPKDCMSESFDNLQSEVVAATNRIWTGD